MNEKPSLPSAWDVSIYELHIRVFSNHHYHFGASDTTVDPSICGGYLAFTCWKKWKSVGKCTYLKPILSKYSFGLILEVSIKILVFCVTILLNAFKYLTDMEMLETLPPDLDEQQAQIRAIQNEDGYN
ncbi:hypothetical protein RJ641_036336 [Dillenia turbinata]|uniref:Uncharacterized protein n=1 Tax=Dillenia turbinata TaxID=194707 RepID=A0AAN8VPR6_9MAGN